MLSPGWHPITRTSLLADSWPLGSVAKHPKETALSILLAFLSATLGGISDFAGGTLSRRLPALVVVASSQLVGAVIIWCFILSTSAYRAPLNYLGWAVGAGVTLAVGLACFYAALARGTMSVVASVAALGVVVPLLWALVAGETPTSVQLVGVVLGIFGIVASCGPELPKSGKRSALGLAAIAGASIGAALTLTAQGSQSDVVMTSGVTKLTIVGALFTMVLVGGPTARPTHRDWGLILLIAGADLGAGLAFGWASAHGLLSLVSVITSLYPIVTVILARAIDKEHLQSSQKLGVACALLGAVLIAGPS